MYSFFAYMSRLPLISRWSLMRTTHPENDAEHSLQCAMIAHQLALYSRDVLGNDVDPEHVMALAVYHDATEILTGDLPTPVKYHSQALRKSYREVEELSAQKLLSTLPESMQEAYRPYFFPASDMELRLVKAADRLCAYLKSVEETAAGNREFEAALTSIRQSLESMDMDEVRYFMQTFEPAFHLTLDEMNGV